MRTPDCTKLVCEEALLGPPLMLALALQSTFALHGSALLRDDQAVILIGQSGAGKSTLGQELASLNLGQRIADDIIPVSASDKQGCVHPHFPQLKLSENEQYPITAKDILAVAAVVEVVPVAASETPNLTPVNCAQAMQTLIRHTVAARLFPPDLLNRHFAFCAHLSRSIPVFQLRYPHYPDAVIEAHALLQQYLIYSYA